MAGTAAMNAETRQILADTNTREADIVILSPVLHPANNENISGPCHLQVFECVYHYYTSFRGLRHSRA